MPAVSDEMPLLESMGFWEIGMIMITYGNLGAGRWRSLWRSGMYPLDIADCFNSNLTFEIRCSDGPSSLIFLFLPRKRLFEPLEAPLRIPFYMICPPYSPLKPLWVARFRGPLGMMSFQDG